MQPSAAQQLLNQYWQICYRDSRAAQKLASAALAACDGPTRETDATWAQLLFLAAEAMQRPQTSHVVEFNALSVEFRLRDDAEGVVLACAQAAMAWWREGDALQGWNLLLGSLPSSLQALPPLQRYSVIEALHCCADGTGNIREYLRFAYEALILARQLDEPGRISLSLSYVARAHLQHGNVSEGLRGLQEAMALAERHKLTQRQYASAPRLALAYLAQAQIEAAEATLAGWRVNPTTKETPPNEAAMLGCCISLYLAAGKPALAATAQTHADTLKQLATCLRPSVYSACRLAIAWALARWQRGLGDYLAAIATLTMAEPAFQTCSVMFIQMDARHELYLNHVALGNNEAALDAHIDFAERQVRLLDGAHSLRLQTMAIQHAVETERLSRQRADLATQEKSAFIANMSHEIRTPMNSVIGLTHLALQTDLSARQRDYLSHIQGAGESLLGLINGILDFSAPAHLAQNSEASSFDLDALLTTIATTTRHQAAAKQLDYIFAVAADVPRQLNGDALRLSQVLTNLLDNALKFTPHGGEVELSVRLGAADSGTLAFSVRDSGIGMSAAQLAQLFAPATHDDNARAHRGAGLGLGLGLSIVQHLVALMGGRISAQSAPRQGTCVDIALPFHPVEQPAAALAANPPQHCLVLHPHSASRQAIGPLLSTLSLRADVVADLAAGNKAMRKATGAQAYRLLMIDERLADDEGIAWLQRCKATAPPDAPLQIWLLTNEGDEAVQDRANAAGIDGLLYQPLTRSAILAAFNRPDAPTIAAQRDAQRLRYQGQRILLAEDNRINQQIAAELLEMVGLTVDVADDGETAVQLALAGGESHYAMILMDLQMPKLDGHATTLAIRQDPRLASTPIVALTAHAIGDIRERCLRDGMQDYLSKPISPAQLYQLLERWLTPTSTPVVAPVAITASKPAPPTVPPAPVVPPKNVDNASVDLALLDELDTAQGLLYMGGKRELYLKLLTRFKQNQADSIANIRQLLTDQAFADAERLVHTMKGLAGSMGAKRVQTDAAALEHALHDNQQAALPDDADALVDALDKSLSALLNQLEQYLPATTAAIAPSKHNSKAALAKLQSLLAEYSGNSLSYFETEKSAIGLAFEATTLQQISDHLQRFEFDEASALLKSKRLAE